MPSYGSVPAPHTHNKLRGAALLLACSIGLALIVSAMHLPMFSVVTVEYQQVATNGGGNKTSSAKVTSTETIALTKTCVGVHSKDPSIKAHTHCTSTLDDEANSCPQLTARYKLIYGIYIATAVLFGLSIAVAVFDLAGFLREPRVHCVTCGIASLAAMVCFVLVMLTYHSTFCGDVNFSNETSSLGASFYLCLVSSMMGKIGAVLVRFLKNAKTQEETEEEAAKDTYEPLVNSA